MFTCKESNNFANVIGFGSFTLKAVAVTSPGASPIILPFKLAMACALSMTVKPGTSTRKESTTALVPSDPGRQSVTITCTLQERGTAQSILNTYNVLGGEITVYSNVVGNFIACNSNVAGAKLVQLRYLPYINTWARAAIINLRLPSLSMLILVSSYITAHCNDTAYLMPVRRRCREFDDLPRLGPFRRCDYCAQFFRGEQTFWYENHAFGRCRDNPPLPAFNGAGNYGAGHDLPAGGNGAGIHNGFQRFTLLFNLLSQ